jgi:hypothetical protein
VADEEVQIEDRLSRPLKATVVCQHGDPIHRLRVGGDDSLRLVGCASPRCWRRSPRSRSTRPWPRPRPAGEGPLSTAARCRRGSGPGTGGARRAPPGAEGWRETWGGRRRSAWGGV